MVGYLIPNPFYSYKQFYFKQFSLASEQIFAYTQLNVKTVQFLMIQFGTSSVQISRTSIWSIDSTLPGATTPGQSGLGSSSNKGILCIPQSSSINGASPSDCLVSYTGHLLGES